MAKFTDLVGQRFGRLVVTSIVRRCSAGSFWRASCDCGELTEAYGSNLRAGRTRSCGCLNRQRVVARNTKHGHAPRCGQSREHLAWTRMLRRCFDTRDADYPNYGGRGITVCADWREDFSAFFSHVGQRPSTQHSLDRIDNERDYEPGNVRWATRLEQVGNRRVTVRLTYLGDTDTLANWCRRLNMPYDRVKLRVHRYGWSTERALTTPAYQRHKSSHL